MSKKPLILAATNEEIDPFFASKKWDRDAVDVLVTGIGMMQTAYRLSFALSKTWPSCVIHVGIAGAYDRSLALGEVVEVVSDAFGDLGAEDADGNFLSIDDLGFPLMDPDPLVITSPLFSPMLGIRAVSGLTVNTVSGCLKTIEQRQLRYNPQIETMESAAAMYVCRQFDFPCYGLRAISNYVEPRNREHWKIGLAIKNLNEKLIEAIQGAF